MNKLIERSAGQLAEINGMKLPFIVGGGYDGATPELDKTVENIAEKLLELYRRPVEIRFNSHQKSGGAWLKNNDGTSAAKVGVGARLWKNGTKGLYITVYLDKSILHNSALADQGHDKSHSYTWYDTIDDAVKFVKEQTDISKL